MSSRVSAVVAALVLGTAVAGCSGGDSGGSVATVNGTPISKTDFDNRLEGSQQAKGIFNQMVQGILIDQYAKDNHIDIPEADVDKKEDDIKSKYPPGQFEQILKTQSLTEDDVKRILREQLIVEKAVGATISTADMMSYLSKNHATLDTPAQVRVRHILVPDLATAQKVEAQLKAGAKFEDMATKYSTDPGSKSKGGELGFISRGQMVKPFEDASFSQPLNVIGPPVKSPFGYHIIQVEEKKPAQVASLANSSDKIRAALSQQQIPQFLNSLRAKANIQISDDKLKDALPPAAPPPPAATPAASTPTTAPTGK
jgi:foldase protein PrsA